MIVVGGVADEELDWFTDRPLFGCSVVVTRARAQASELTELGAEVVHVPVSQVADPEDGGAALRAAVAGIAGYDWLVLTSPNGVHRTFAHVPTHGRCAG